MTEREIMTPVMRAAMNPRVTPVLIGLVVSLMSAWPFASADAGISNRNWFDHRPAPFWSVPFWLAADEGTLAQAQAALQAGDVATARRIWLALAEMGDPAARYQLGVFAETQGADKDFEDAVAWYAKAAASGYAAAQLNLAAMYESGRGIRQDNVQARHWYELAAAQGDPQALTHLAVMQYRGLGGAKDVPSAVDSFTKAAKLGVARAQFDLAILFEEGKGVTADPAAAAALYRQAANQNYAQAQTSLGLLYSRGSGVRQDLAAAHDLFLHAAELGDVRGQFYLAISYRLGNGTPVDKVAALRWFAIAADHGHIDAMRQRNELTGEMSKFDVEKAMQQANGWQPAAAAKQ